MATKKEIDQELKRTLKEIGEIRPYYDRHVGEWVFRHPDYPVECGGETREEVICNYPLYLRDFIEERLNDNLSPLTEKATRGRGGKRPGAGRPKGSIKEAKTRVYVPEEIAGWLRDPMHLEMVRRLKNSPQEQRRLLRDR